MSRESARCDGTLNRRAVLRATGGVVGASAVGGVVSGQASASVTVEDQKSDGSTVVVSEVSTSVETTLILYIEGGENDTLLADRPLSAGDEFSDLALTTEEPIGDYGQVTALVVREVDGEDELLARDEALIAVDEDAGVEGAQFRIYEGVGHTPRPVVDDLVEFHRRSLAGEDVSEFAGNVGSDRSGAGQVDGAGGAPADGTIQFSEVVAVISEFNDDRQWSDVGGRS